MIEECVLGPLKKKEENVQFAPKHRYNGRPLYFSDLYRVSTNCFFSKRFWGMSHKHLDIVWKTQTWAFWLKTGLISMFCFFSTLTVLRERTDFWAVFSGLFFLSLHQVPAWRHCYNQHKCCFRAGVMELAKKMWDS